MKCTLYKYGGAISSNLIQIDTADIKFCDLYDKLDLEKSPEKEKLQAIYNHIEKQNLKDVITLSDDRLVYVFYKLLVRGFFKEIGLNEWFICYRFWNIYYDSGVPYIDLLIRFLNLQIGTKFTSLISADEIKEINILAGKLKEFDMNVPEFVKQAVSEGAPEISAEPVLAEIKTAEKEKNIIQEQINDAVAALEIMAIEDKDDVYKREIRRLKLKNIITYEFGGELQEKIA